jgi:hypothetical protein
MPLPIFKHMQEENRQLRKLNAEMLAALKSVLPLAEYAFKPEHATLHQVRAVIAKAENDQ